MATNTAYATYTEVIDLQTTNGTQSIIGIHTPVGASPYERLKGFFTQFRKYKYNGIKSLVMVPAAQLPVDPLGLTGIVGTTDLMDPRDSLNPILFHGAHGENLTDILNTIYSQSSAVGAGNNSVNLNGGNVSPSADEFHVGIASDLAEYYSKLTDSSWRKFGIQSGVKLSGLRPLVHQVVQNMPSLPSLAPDTGISAELQQFYRNNGVFQPYNPATGDFTPLGEVPTNFQKASMPVGTRQSVLDYAGETPSSEYLYKQQFTNRMTTLGWLPTTVIQNTPQGTPGISIAALPKCFMGVLVMPPAYNVEQFFRCVITHSFSFKDFTSSLGAMDIATPEPFDSNIPYANWIDYGSAEGGSKTIDAGTTLDVIGGKSQVVSDGVM